MSYKTYEVRVYADGSKAWYLGGKLHREDGPAVEYVDGSQEWYLNGNLHRKDRPAVERADGYKSWWLNGEHLSEEAHREQMSKIKVKELTVAEVEKLLGYNIKIVK